MEATKTPRPLTVGRVPRPVHTLRVVQPISQAVREEMETAAAIFADAVAELERRAAERYSAEELDQLAELADQDEREADAFALSLANLCM